MKERTVLFVDDEERVLNSLRRGLIEEKYKCLFATSGQEALEIMEETKISVLVTDMKMPGMNGLELLKSVKNNYPNIVKIVLTGYTQLPQILATINQVDVFKIITKPWKLEDEFVYIIRQALEYYEFKEESFLLKHRLEMRNSLYQNILKSTEKKLESIRKDLDNLKRINSVFVTCIKEAITENQSWFYLNQHLIQYLDVYERILNKYVDILPSNYENFKMDRLKDDLNNYLQINNYLNRVKCNWQVELDIKMNQKYQIIYFLITSIIENCLNINNENIIEINVMKITYENIISINVSIEVPPYIINEIEPLNNKYSLAYLILKEISKAEDFIIEYRRNTIEIQFSNN